MNLQTTRLYAVTAVWQGAKAADLPVEQPTIFELAINRTTANTLGIDIPTTLIAAADQVID